MFTEPGTAREEAERLVAAVLAAATVAAHANPQISTGSAECCVCPLCKVIAAVRDPDPQTVERIATGAGDLAAGVASFLRHIGNAAAGAKDAWATASDPSDDPPSSDSATHAAPDTLSTTGKTGRGNGTVNGAGRAKGTATRASATGWPAETAAGGDGDGTNAVSGSSPSSNGPAGGKGGASAVGRATSAAGEKLAGAMPVSGAPGSGAGAKAADGDAAGAEQMPGPRKAPKKAAQAKATLPKKAAGVDGEALKMAKVVKKAIRKKTES
jgi:hypothetical protein